LSLHGKTITNRKRVQADCNMEGMSIQGAVRSDVVHAYQSSVLSSVPATIVVLPQISLARRLGGAQGRRPEPTMTNWGNARKTCAIIPHGPARHSRAQPTRASCLQGCLRYIDFRHNTETIAALLMTTHKIDAYRTARLHGALTSQEIAKHVKYCLKPVKAPGLDKCLHELLKTITDEDFLIS